MKPLPLAQFEELVADALDEVPAELMALLDNVVFLVEIGRASCRERV